MKNYIEEECTEKFKTQKGINNIENDYNYSTTCKKKINIRKLMKEKKLDDQRNLTPNGGKKKNEKQR